MLLFNKLVNDILAEKFSEDDRISIFNDFKDTINIEIEKSKQENSMSETVYELFKHLTNDLFALKQNNRSSNIIPELERIYLEIRNAIKIGNRVIRLKRIINLLETGNYNKARIAFNSLKKEGIDDKEVNELTKTINDIIIEKEKEKQEYKQQRLNVKKQEPPKPIKEKLPYKPKRFQHRRSQIAARRALNKIKNSEPKPSPAQKALDKIKNSQPKPPIEKKPQYTPKLSLQQIIQRSLDRINNK
jgi:hypothetical protein